MPDEAGLERERRLTDIERASEDEYHRHLAAEIVAMLPYVRTDALRVLRLVDDILKRTRPELPPSEPPPSEPPPDAA